jgi:hypothetical protein
VTHADVQWDVTPIDTRPSVREREGGEEVEGGERMEKGGEREEKGGGRGRERQCQGGGTGARRREIAACPHVKLEELSKFDGFLRRLVESSSRFI